MEESLPTCSLSIPALVTWVSSQRGSITQITLPSLVEWHRTFSGAIHLHHCTMRSSLVLRHWGAARTRRARAKDFPRHTSRRFLQISPRCGFLGKPAHDHSPAKRFPSRFEPLFLFAADRFRSTSRGKQKKNEQKARESPWWWQTRCARSTNYYS